MIRLPKVLPSPALPAHLPENAKWLAGEGAGSWFVIEDADSGSSYKVSRFSPEGRAECEGVFTATGKIDLARDFSVTYPSHCAEVNVVQDSANIRMTVAVI